MILDQGWLIHMKLADSSNHALDLVMKLFYKTKRFFLDISSQIFWYFEICPQIIELEIYSPNLQHLESLPLVLIKREYSSLILLTWLIFKNV